MSIDKSLKRKSTGVRNRSVLKRSERILALQESDRFKEGQSPFGLPKVRVVKIVLKKAKKEKTEDEGAAKDKKK
ncbi:small basic protein [Telmatocola sphagniphila]|uniref:Small basic protein n=1 Tax=Telmatocola sphagniphila TaxID=1123043 RepID=A0A8E6BBC0_9BACT|nr:small basic protein [Telmatocola sphagniphila]QVL34596.1 small basic protein [Telmatocola sphagniphila]